MEFTDQGNTKIIKFEESDSDSEKRFVERQFWSLRELLVLIKEKNN